MQIPLLLIGTGYDGPSNKPVRVDSIEKAFEVFGAYRYENVEIDAAQTTFTLAQSGVADLEFFHWRDGILESFEEISGVVIDGTTVTNERVGRDVDLVVKYIRPFASDSSLVYKGYGEAASTAGGEIWVMRVGGTPATVDISGAEGSKLTLISKYGGELYNQGVILYDNVTLTVIQPPGKGEPRYYSLTGKTVVELVEEINLDYAKGYTCYKATCTGSGSAQSGNTDLTILFSGGTDGEFTDQEVVDTLTQTDLRGIKVVCVLGKLQRGVSADPHQLRAFLTSDVIEDMPYPTMFVQGVRYDPSLTASAYASGLSSLKEIISTSVTLVVGENWYNYGRVSPYWASLAPTYAAVLAASNGPCVHIPIGARAVRPTLTKDTLTSLSTSGFAAISYSIARGYVVYSDVSSDPHWDSLCYNVYLAAVSRTYPITESLVGAGLSAANGLQEILEEELSGIPNLKDYDVVVKVFSSGVIDIQIALQPYGRLDSIRFGVKINANASAPA